MERKKVAKVLRWLLAGLTVLVAALLIWQCLDIYFAGTAETNIAANGTRIHDIYSREIVAERLKRISWAGILWLAVWLAAVLLDPRQPLKEPGGMSAQTRLALMYARVEQTPAMAAEQRKRRCLKAIAYGICAVCMGFVIAYFLDPAHFASRELEPVMGNMLLHCLPFVAAGLCALIVLAQLLHASMLRELDCAKTAPKREPESDVRPHERNASILRIALYAAAVALLAAGIVNGGMRDVLIKAVNICTECIGLG